MDVSAISGSAIPAAAAAAKPANTSDQAPATAADTVTLSPAAQQIAANTAPSLADSYVALANASDDQNLKTFYSTAAVVVDTTGQYSAGEQLDAYQKFMGTGGGALDFNTWTDVFFAVRDKSAIGQKVHAVTDAYNQAAMRATQTEATDTTPGIAQAKLDAANALSDFDREVLFRTGTRSTGAFTDMQQWLAALQSEATGNANGDTTPFAKNAETFYSLAAIVTNVTGKYAQDDQLSAYAEFQKMQASGAFDGRDRAADTLSSQTLCTSAVATQLNTLADSRVIAGKAGYLSGGSAGAAKADLNWFNSLSDSDQTAFFKIALSGRYDDVEQYKAEQSAQIVFQTYLRDHLGPHGAPPSTEALRADPTLAKVWAMAVNNAIKPQDFIDQIASLLGTDPNALPDDGTQQPAEPTDAEKALATLKAYVAGTAPKTDGDKALAALQSAQTSGDDDSAALSLLKQAAERPVTGDTGSTKPASVNQTDTKTARNETGLDGMPFSLTA
jgi:hypothetical protein